MMQNGRTPPVDRLKGRLDHLAESIASEAGARLRKAQQAVEEKELVDQTVLMIFADMPSYPKIMLMSAEARMSVMAAKAQELSVLLKPELRLVPLVVLTVFNAVMCLLKGLWSHPVEMVKFWGWMNTSGNYHIIRAAMAALQDHTKLAKMEMLQGIPSKASGTAFSKRLFAQVWDEFEVLHRAAFHDVTGKTELDEIIDAVKNPDEDYPS